MPDLRLRQSRGVRHNEGELYEECSSGELGATPVFQAGGYLFF